MNPLAVELNSVLDETVAGRLFSGFGRRLFFPKGIIAQSAEAKLLAPVKNATIGMAFKGGQPLILSAVAESMPTLSSKEAVTYAPTPGFDPVRQAWKELLVKKNPSLDPDAFSLPVVVPGITAGISYTADLFLDKGTVMLASDPCWDNYSLIFAERREAELKGIPFFGSGPGLDIQKIGKALKEEAKSGSVRIILNFPNNPSGYSPTLSEVNELVQLIGEIAEGGADVLVICDDAYFGLFYDDTVHRESLFSALACLHDRVLAVKVDGPTKEDYVWGLRMGFLSFGSRGLGGKHYEALIKKLMGVIRSSVSCANSPAQYLMLKVMEDSRTAGEKDAFFHLLQSRYRAVKNFVNTHKSSHLDPMPFNSGYFMSFRCIGVNAEALRLRLLSEHGIGVIALGASCLRVAFAALEEDQIPKIYEAIYEAAEAL
jgi:aspartate/methionine/tyrosine aminotransferase